ncbi:MAG TPA: hypothetical protein VGJ75_05130 [Dongiaceae bacterium]|jgi:hypothetical protein
MSPPIPGAPADRRRLGRILGHILARWSGGLLVVLLLCSSAVADAPKAVSTFESIGVYWRSNVPPSGTDDGDCRIEFRAKGTGKWREGLPLWYDAKGSEYRGSLVGLQPGTTYEIRLTLGNGTSETLEAATWSEHPPIAKTVHLPEFSDQTLQITQSGTPDGYVLYAPAPGKSAIIDVGKAKDFDVVVNAKYVIVRGLTLKGAKHSGILLGPTAEANSADVSDIVIENNDVSGWGENDPACKGQRAYGTNLQAAIYAFSDKLQRVVVQRNKLHHPSTGANSWKEQNCSGTGSKHPMGPQGITIRKSLGNLVIRYNEIYSDDRHTFNDGMGEPDNFSTGFPRSDSDIYGNLIRNTWDDGIESEGLDRNVRIWGNYIDRVMIPIALAPASDGPIYIWRNISNISRSGPGKTHGASFIKSRLTSNAIKTGDSGGRVYLFNNTALTPRNSTSTTGFLAEFDKANRLGNYRTLNNIMSVDNPRKDYSIRVKYGTGNIFDFDLLSGRTAFPDRQEAHGARAMPKFTHGFGLDENTKVGSFALAPSSAGYDQGRIIPNFADSFVGKAPDMGAQEAGMPPMEFGVNAYRKATQ